jgi:hypothetical protein
MFDHFASCYTLGSDPSLHQSDLSKYIYTAWGSQELTICPQSRRFYCISTGKGACAKAGWHVMLSPVNIDNAGVQKQPYHSRLTLLN